MWSTRGPRTSTGLRAAQDSGGPSIVKVLLRLIPNMLICELVPLCYRGEGQRFHDQFDILKFMNPLVFIKDLDAALMSLF